MNLRSDSIRKHVFNDLQPYICTFETCAAKPFASRHAWFEHELRNHRKEWFCNLCEYTSSFSSATAFQSHLQEYHGEEVTECQLPAIVALCEEPLSEICPEDCPLCNEWALGIRTRELAINPDSTSKKIVVTPVQFRRHLGSHFEQLALFALPKHHGDEDVNDIDSNDAKFDGSSCASFITASTGSSLDPKLGGSTPLYIATKHSQISEVARLLANGADPNSLGSNAESSLQLASRSGNYEIVRILLEHGASVDIPGRHGTALHVALLSLKLSIVRILVEYGADSNYLDPDRNQTILQSAVSIGFSDIVEFLLEHGADPNHPGVDGSHRTALQIAATGNHLEVVKMLLDHGADLETQGPDGTALQAASFHGRLGNVRILLDRGADCNSSGPKGTALQAAGVQGYPDIVNILLDHGANLESQGPNGTALQAAVTYGHLETAKSLIQCGANVNSPPGPEGTALQAASGFDRPDVVETLLNHGAEINSQGPIGPALHCAVGHGHIDNVKILLERGANPLFVTPHDNMTALQIAALHGYLNIAELLVRYGGSVNCPLGIYGTALQIAVSHGHREVANMLLDSGADPNSPPGPNGTALQAAKDYPDIQKLLLTHGAEAEKQTSNTVLERERAAIIIKKILRQNHRRASGRLTFADSVLLVCQYLKPERRESHACWPPDPTAIEKKWGELFDKHGQPTYRLDQFFRGIVISTMQDFSPKSSTRITSKMMRQFYRRNRVQDLKPQNSANIKEVYDWDRVFSNPIGIYQELGIEYHVSGGITDFTERMSSLTPRGFSKWMTLLIQCFPKEESLRLDHILFKYWIGNPDLNLAGQPEQFPNLLSSRLLPSEPNTMLRQKFENVMQYYHAQGQITHSSPEMRET